MFTGGTIWLLTHGHIWVLSVQHGRYEDLPQASPEVAPLFAFLLFWGPFVFHSPGKYIYIYIFAGVLIPA